MRKPSEHKQRRNLEQRADELVSDSLASGRIEGVRDGSDEAIDGIAKKRSLTFVANPIQRAFILSQATADLFAARMGEGKSAGLVWASFHHARCNPGARQVFLRDTWENLRATTQVEFFDWFTPGELGDYEKSTKTWTWKIGEMRGAKAYFIGMNSPEDAQKFQSRSLAGLFVDEPAPAAESGGIDEFVLETGMSRLRQKGIQWYAAKLATNNPDESHWTYRKFVNPGSPDWKCWQTQAPENMRNLPPAYYEKMRSTWAHRPDLIARFVDGKFGFQQHGRAVTPEWNDAAHLATGLIPEPGRPVTLCWDFGSDCSCVITQTCSDGTFQVLDCFTGEGEKVGVGELVEQVVLHALETRYKGFSFSHVGDPSGAYGQNSSYDSSGVRAIQELLGGGWRPGPVRPEDRVEPLRALLARRMLGRGVMQVDRHRAVEIWHALRGGWNYKILRNGDISQAITKNKHSHPADALGYGVALEYPLGRGVQGRRTRPADRVAGNGTKYFGIRGSHRLPAGLVRDMRGATPRWVDER